MTAAFTLKNDIIYKCVATIRAIGMAVFTLCNDIIYKA